HPRQVRTQLIDGVRLSRPRPQPLNPLSQLVDDLLEQFLEQVFLVLEIEIERAACDAGAGNDVRDIGPVISLASKDALGVAQHLRASGLAFHRAFSVRNLQSSSGYRAVSNPPRACYETL